MRPASLSCPYPGLISERAWETGPAGKNYFSRDEEMISALINLNKGPVDWAGCGMQHLTILISSSAKNNWGVSTFIFILQMRKLACWK